MLKNVFTKPDQKVFNLYTYGLKSNARRETKTGMTTHKACSLSLFLYTQEVSEPVRDTLTRGFFKL